MNHNFAILKQCLMKIKEMEGSLGQLDEVNTRVKDMASSLAAREEAQQQNNRQIQELSNNVGDDFMVCLL